MRIPAFGLIVALSCASAYSENLDLEAILTEMKVIHVKHSASKYVVTIPNAVTPVNIVLMQSEETGFYNMYCSLPVEWTGFLQRSYDAPVTAEIIGRDLYAFADSVVAFYANRQSIADENSTANHSVTNANAINLNASLPTFLSWRDCAKIKAWLRQEELDGKLVSIRGNVQSILESKLQIAPFNGISDTADFTFQPVNVSPKDYNPLNYNEGESIEAVGTLKVEDGIVFISVLGADVTRQ